MNHLVSIIIPCYNSEQWIGEAIDSALTQTYSPIEVIIIDDGSTDESLKIIKSYGTRVRWETGNNRGQSAARNRGFSLSNGKYIQWLDADDYILSKKIENQVSYLEEFGCDIVYGDWRYQYHGKNGQIHLSGIKVTGHQKDILESLLSGFALTIMNCLTKREIIKCLNGFDDTLRATEDIFFWIEAAILGAKFGYQSGCYSFYRRHGNTTISTKNIKSLCDSTKIILERSQQLLITQNKLDEKYKKALAKSHFNLAKWYLNIDKSSSYQHMRKVRELQPEFKPSEHALYETVFRFLGFTLTANLFVFKTKIAQLFIKQKF